MATIQEIIEMLRGELMRLASGQRQSVSRCSSGSRRHSLSPSRSGKWICSFSTSRRTPRAWTQLVVVER